MIRQSVSLASNGIVNVPGYAQMVSFGYTKNRGVYRLAVTATGEWEGLAVRCFWHTPGGKDPPSSLVADGYVDVPASVTAQSGNGCITFEGSDGTKTVTSADLRYRVSANSGTEDGTMPEPGTPAWQQLVEVVHTNATAAEKARKGAESAADRAETAQQKTEDVRKDALDKISTAKADALKAVDAKQTAATAAVESTQKKALDAVTAAQGTAVKAVSDAQSTATQAVQTAQTDAVSAVEKAGSDVLASIPEDYQTTVQKVEEMKTEKAEIDDSTVGLDAWSSKHIVDMLCPPLEETGASVQCYPVAGYPLGCKVSWEPTQEGSGEPSPENIRPIKGRDSVTVERCGENLLDISPENIESGIYKNGEKADGLLNSKQQRILRPIAINPGQYMIFTTFYTLNLNARATFLTHNGNYLSDISLRYNHPTKVPENACFMLLHSSTEGFSETNPMIAIGSTPPTTYTPYTGQTTTLTLPTTIYGGTVDAATGEGQEAWKLITLDGTEKFRFFDSYGVFYIDSKDYADSMKTIAPMSNFYKGVVGVSAIQNGQVGVSSGITSWLFAIKDERFKDTSAFLTYLAAQYAAGAPVQIAYKLATPVPIKTTGAQPIPALSGVNTVLTDSDSVTVTGRADPIKRITDLEDAVASMT